MVEVHPENFKSIRIVATRDSNSIRMEMSRVANVSFITHDDAAATWLPGSRRRRRLADAAALLAATAAPPPRSAPGALCTWGCRVATIDGNWTGVDDNYPPNNCFPLKQD